MTELNTEAIKKIIPHRYPMLLIDRVTELDSGKKAEAIHNVSFNEPFVQANKANVFPAPLIVETLV